MSANYLIKTRAISQAFLLFILLFLSAKSYSQAALGDTLYVLKPMFRNNLIFQNGHHLRLAKVKKLCVAYPEIKPHLRTVRNINFIAYPQSVVTGFAMGIGTVYLMKGVKPVLGVVLTSNGILGFINLFVLANYQKSEMKTVCELYNKRLKGR